MRIFDKAMYTEKLHEYYMKNYGDEKTDIWYDQPAVNVWVFRRGVKYVSLKSHILTGEVVESVETEDSVET